MIQAMHNGASGMSAQQKNVDTIANNIANINTVGYIKSRIDFKDAMYSTMINPDNPDSTENLQQGNGVLIGGASKIYKPSAYIETGNPLDFSINGTGFFAVQGKNGIINYTKDGSFKISEENGQQFLVTSNGDYVLNDSMQKINIDGKAENMTVDSSGNIIFDGNTEPSAKMGIFEFTNNMGLESGGNNLMSETPASGQPFIAQDSEVKQKFLESSNVDLTDEMTQLIKAQRAYQIAAKAVNTADEMEALANSMRS